MSGQFTRIDQLGYKDCFGFYSNMEALKTEFRVSFNFKRCDASIWDLISGDGEEGPGFHVYCFYENSNEFDLINPLYWDGFHYKWPMWETCWDDKWAKEAARNILWGDEPFVPFWDVV